MPLIVEKYDERNQRWQTKFQLVPGDPVGCFSNNTANGHHVIIFGCAENDFMSFVARSPDGTDAEIEDIRVAQGLDGFQMLAELRNGGSFETSIMTDASVAYHKMRFRHVVVDFGTRHCELCGQDVSANRFGRHVFFDHPVEEWDRWPGGLRAAITALRKSAGDSLKAAHGFPRLEVPLLESLEALKQLELRLNAHNN